MTSAEIYQWMDNPTLLNKSSLLELRQMVDDFPYFHAVRMLYLKNLAMLNDVRLATELKKMSVYVPDRRKLFMLIENKRFEEKPAVVKEFVKTDENVGEPDISGEEQVEIEPEHKTTVKPTAAAVSDYTKWLEENVEDIPTSDGKANKLQHQDVIDSVMRNVEKISGKRIELSLKTPDKSAAESAGPDLGDSSIDDSYFTETLARVYFKQKRYDKALEIIRVLNLKYPKKSAYFADQIRYLERIINIKK